MKKIIGVFLCLAFMLGATSMTAASAKEHIIDWGVTPNDKEMTPQIPDFAGTMLQNHNGIFVGDTNQKQVYLTFDLGYEAGYTNQVLDILKAHNIKAIFFLCGHYLTENLLVERMIAEGHTIGNHTNKHKDLPKQTDEAIRADIAEFDAMYKEKFAHGNKLKHFRPPSGRISERVLKIANEEGLKTLMWSSAIVDWGKAEIDAKANSDKLIRRTHPGNIILLHITNAGTPKMLEMLIGGLSEKGYTVGDAGAL
ncbi:MAG: polysaccharide deacetylase family protein [Firmicutes bacterium]|nr:polysaccharide deacetylase family protein [Bacillota bacterium]